MSNYFDFPRWDYVISEIPRDKRPIFCWVLRDHTSDEWLGDVDEGLQDGRIKKIYQVCLYDRNTLFNRTDLGVFGSFEHGEKVQMLPVDVFVIYDEAVDTDSEWVEEVEFQIRSSLAWEYEWYTSAKYVNVSELDKIFLCVYPDDFEWDAAHCASPSEDYTLVEPEYEEQTVGEVIEGLIEYERGNPRWC